MSVENKVRQIIADHLEVPLENVVMEATIEGDLSADGLHQMEIIMELEDEFSIKIPDDDLDILTTVRSLVERVELMTGTKK